MLQVPMPSFLALKSGWPVQGKGDWPAPMPSSPSSQPMPHPFESPKTTTSRCGSGGGDPGKQALAISATTMLQTSNDNLRIGSPRPTYSVSRELNPSNLPALGFQHRLTVFLRGDPNEMADSVHAFR